MISKLLVSLFFITNLAFAVPVTDENRTEVNSSTLAETQNSEQQTDVRLTLLQAQVDAIDKEILEKSVLAKIYSNYSTLKVLQKEYESIQKNINSLKLKKRLTAAEQEHLDTLMLESDTLQGKLELLIEYEKDPFKSFLSLPGSKRYRL